MTAPFRFIHASDLHLERPLRGLADVPDHLRPALAEAPYRGAQRVFDIALKEEIDFLVIAGDLIDPALTGPRGVVFLNEQFQRLADKGIRVYWSGGPADNFERWVDAWSLPDSVWRFSSGCVERVLHERDGQTIAQILGASVHQRRKVRVGEFQADTNPWFTLAVVSGQTDADAVAGHGVHYWALGGEHERRMLTSGPITAHYPGTPQGRKLSEAGPHGCSLVQVDEARRVRVSFLATDAIRYQQERVVVSPSTSPGQLYQVISERIGELLSDPFGPDLLVQWTVLESPALANELRRGKLAADLTTRLRSEFGTRHPAAWTIAVEPEAHESIRPGLMEQDSVLGEFLRTVEHYSEHPEAPLDLNTFLTERQLTGNVGEAAALDDSSVRRRVLADVARLGIELLSPEEPRT